MTSIIEPMQRVALYPRQLMADYPPELEDANKKLVFDIAHPRGGKLSGQIGFTRWEAMELPSNLALSAVLETTDGKADIYDYRPVSDIPSATEWHVNFADRYLFVAYGSGLFAQDEMQVAEHFVLASLSEYLIDNDMPSSTISAGSPTPVLISGAARSCRIETDVSPLMGRPYGLYGNEFSDATDEAIRVATTRLNPPATTNIIATATPEYGWGDYERTYISYTLTTAYTGFKAAVLESAHLPEEHTPVVVHTGYWGCGAFGGNRELMAMLQMLAAEIAGLTRLVFHTVSESGLVTLEEAKDRIAAKGLDDIKTSEDLINRIVDMRFQWGGQQWYLMTFVGSNPRLYYLKNFSPNCLLNLPPLSCGPKPFI